MTHQQELTANSLSNTHPSPLSPQGVAAEPHQIAVAAVVRVPPLECLACLVDSCHACGASEGEAVSHTASSERLLRPFYYTLTTTHMNII